MFDNRQQSSQPTVVFIDSEVEQEAWLVATFGPADSWNLVSQTWQVEEDGERREVLEIETGSGEHVLVAFAEASPDDSLSGEGVDRTGEMEELMQRAAEYAEQNPPHHPGSLPRFPVPSPSYKHAIAVPMTVLALDDAGHRGLYAPPRQVAMLRDDATLVGVGEYPGFDPEQWPPPLLGAWPPHHLAHMPHSQLQAMIARFSACWSRVLDAWFSGTVVASAVLKADIQEALHRRSVLDLATMLPYYDRLNPVFAKWLKDMLGPDTEAETTP